MNSFFSNQTQLWVAAESYRSPVSKKNEHLQKIYRLQKITANVSMSDYNCTTFQPQMDFSADWELLGHLIL